MTEVTSPDYLRGQEFFNPGRNEFAAYTQVGVGGIGSFAAFATAKMGVPHIRLIDPDLVEAHNLPNQMFDASQAWDHKVEACFNNIINVAPECNVTTHVARVTENGWTGSDEVPTLAGVVGSGLDSMTARADLWNQAIKMNPMIPLYIDARLDGLDVVIYAIKPHDRNDVEQYEATLKDEDEVHVGSCTARAIIDVGFTVGAQMARMVRRHYARQSLDKITYIDADRNRIMCGDWLPS